MSRTVFLIAAAVLLFVSPIEAKCWICKAADSGNGAQCGESYISGFAKTNCETREICALAICVKFCATSGSNCTTRPPDDPDPFDYHQAEFLPPANAAQMVNGVFDSWTVAMFGSRTLTAQHEGSTTGMVTFDDGRAYDFRGRVEIHGEGVTTATYRLDDHPDIVKVTVESPSTGQDVYIAVEYADGRNRLEFFSYDR